MTATNDDIKRCSEEIIQSEHPKLTQMFEKYLDFNRLGFKLTHIGVLPHYPYFPYIIYQSNQCKIRFTMEYERRNDPPIISIRYARLHAPIDQYTMVWQQGECYCWHENGKALNFLDGLSPSDVSNNDFWVPRTMREFKQTSMAQGLEHEYIVKMNAYIWDHYGQRLFDLFDLRHPDLWEEYRSFLKQYYEHLDKQNKLKGRPPSPIKPPLYNVC